MSSADALCTLQANQGILSAFLPHLDTAGMAESFVRLVGADEQVVLNAQPEALAWIADTDILSKLLARCCPLSLPDLTLMCPFPWYIRDPHVSLCGVLFWLLLHGLCTADSARHVARRLVAHLQNGGSPTE